MSQFLVTLIIFGVAPQVVDAQDELVSVGKTIALQGNSKGATACVACHGMNGEGQATAGFPQLAGLSSGYIVKQLKDYKSHQRDNPVMFPVAQALSEVEMKQVGVYFESLTPVSVSVESKQASPEQIELGERIARVGLWDKDLPACFACHGPGGVGVGSSFPRLTDQHTSYLSQQIAAWKSGARKNDPNQMMKTVADKLTDQEIEAVIAYLNSLGRKEGK